MGWDGMGWDSKVSDEEEGEGGCVCIHKSEKVAEPSHWSRFDVRRCIDENPYLGVEKHSCELETWFAMIGDLFV